MWLIFALITLLFWSGSDLFSKIGSPENDKYSHFKIVTSVGLIMGLHAMYSIFIGKVPISLDAVIAYLPASLLYIISMLIGYIGLKYIELSVSSPICNSSGAITAILCFFVLRQRLDMPQTIAVVIICIGVFMLGVTEYTEDDEKRQLRQSESGRKYTKSFLALTLPLCYCLLDSIGTFVDSIILDTEATAVSQFTGGFLTNETGNRFLSLLMYGRLNEETANTAYELTFLLIGIICAIYVFGIKRDKPTVKADTPKLLGGLCETIGQFTYVFAISANPIGSAPVISAYCVASVLWSRIFLKEKLSLKHYLCIFLVITGIIILGILEGISGDV